MEELCVFMVVLFGAVSFSQDQVSKSVLEVTVRPGDNITLYCDCKLSTGVYIEWYKNSSHESQLNLVLSTIFETQTKVNDLLRSFPHFQLLRNKSSESYDLLIMNITYCDEGLYYCGTKQLKVEDNEYITSRYIYSYGNITRIICDKLETWHETQQECDSCWMQLFTLCPAFAVLSSLLSSLVVYRLCQKKARAPQVDQIRPDTRGQTRLNQDDNVCYAGLEIHQASQRPKKKIKQSSDFCIYSAINTSGV